MCGQEGGPGRALVIYGERGRISGVGSILGRVQTGRAHTRCSQLRPCLGWPSSFILSLGAPCAAPSEPRLQSLPETQHPSPLHYADWENRPGRGHFINLPAFQGTLRDHFLGVRTMRGPGQAGGGGGDGFRVRSRVQREAVGERVTD